RQILNYLYAITERIGFSPGSAYAMVQPLTFDSCMTVISPALTSGGTLHIITRERATDPHALGEYFGNHRIDCLKITPTHFAALQASSRPHRAMPDRWLIVGGEASHWDWIQGLQKDAPLCNIFNHYGPTEATVGMLTYHLEAGREKHPASIVPMGHPLANTRAYLLDRH